MNGFPDNWPKNCPPNEAQDASGVYYRVGKSNPPATADFKSHVEMNKKSRGDECIRNGLSVFSKQEEARHLIQIFPMLGSHVYQGELQAEHGKVKPTPSDQNPSHTTWWPYNGVDRAKLFQTQGEG